MKGRLLYCATIIVLVVLVFAGSFAFEGAGPFFANLSNEPLNFNDDALTIEDFEENRAMTGNIYWVLDCIGEEYTETTNDSGAVISETTDAYYYTVPFDNNTVMIMKTDADSELEVLIDALYILSDPYFEDYIDDPEYADYLDYQYLLEEGAYAEGVLVETEEEILDLYDEWKTEYPYYIEELFEAYGLECDADKLELVPYTFDTTSTVGDYTGKFFGGSAVLLVFLVIVIAIVIAIIKGRSKKNNQFAPVGGYDQFNGYNQPNNFQPNSYDPNNLQPTNVQPNNGVSSYIPTPVNNDMNNAGGNGVNLNK